jgi:DNA-binding response OmpR family regulator
MTDPNAAAGRRFLLLDAEPGFAEALAAPLRRLAGNAVDCVGTAEAALVRCRHGAYDLLIAGLPLPDISAGVLLARLREAGPGPSVILLASGDEDVSFPPECAPDEIVTRPFRLNLLLALVDALLARRAAAGTTESGIGPYRFRPHEKLLVDHSVDREIRLTEKEVAILEYLVRAGGRTMPRELLLNEVWGYNSGVTTHTLETHVYRLRQKIELDPANAEILVSEPGGYRLATVLGDFAMGDMKS